MLTHAQPTAHSALAVATGHHGARSVGPDCGGNIVQERLLEQRADAGARESRAGVAGGKAQSGDKQREHPVQQGSSQDI